MRFVKLFLSVFILLPTVCYAQRVNREDDIRDTRRAVEDRIQRESKWEREGTGGSLAAIRKNIDEENKKRYSRELPQPDKDDFDQIAVMAEDREKFGAVLKQKNTGIFKLFDAIDCDEETYLLDARQSCPNGFIGKATSYSFRVKKYREKSFSDIFLEDERISIRGFNVLGIITELGEIPLEALSLTAPGVKELSELKPATRISDVKRHLKLIQKGVQVGDYIFRSSAKLRLNNTYLLRSIAYKSKAVPDIKKTFFTFESWSKDKRDDVIIVFKCIRKNDDKSWILVWKELTRTDAPEL